MLVELEVQGRCTPGDAGAVQGGAGVEGTPQLL